MKIKSIAIKSIRGIVEIHLDLDGNNCVIYGTNGTGKSAVIDAIDFLFSGQISRLMGSGTSGITLGKHGKHVDATDLTDCYVEAEILLDGVQETITIKRYLNNPSQLDVEERYKPLLEPYIHIAKKHQFLLTRREILKFITSDGASRSNEIQKLLKLDEIGQTRRTLVQISNRLDTNQTAEERQLGNLRTELHTILGKQPTSTDEALEEINKYRVVLGADPLLDLNPEGFLQNIDIPNTEQKTPKKATQGEVIKIIESLQLQLDQSRVEQAKVTTTKLQSDLDSLRKLGKEMDVIKTVDLLNQGLKVIHSHSSETPLNACPLCLTELNIAELEISIGERLEKAKEINEACKSILETKRTSSIFLSQIVTATNTLNSSITEKSLEVVTNELQALTETLKRLVEILSKDIPELLSVSNLPSLFIQLWEQISNLDFEQYKEKVKASIPAGTSREEAISVLAKTQEKVREINRKKKVVGDAKKALQRAKALVTAFESSQNEVIDSLYDSIKDRFVELYRALHTSDESAFDAEIQQDGASVNLSVDFYGRGQHPPHALHSEGHQDSMGVCLFLALNEKISEDKLKFVVLDDVVTSVDTQHRRELCRMLKSKFPDTQFIITTHDTTWAQQMKSLGVVEKKNLIKFYGWKVDSGPKLGETTDIWQLIQQALDEDDVPTSSQKLRRFCEEFYLNVCAELGASVPCKLDGDWTLGDVFPNAWKRYKELLQEAQRSARSWQNQQLEADIASKQSQGLQIFNRAWPENWAVNRTTHFTHWETLTATDFAPVVEAFKDFTDFLTCPTCHQTCHVTVNRSNPFELESLTCECGGLSFNLRKNSGSVVSSQP